MDKVATVLAAVILLTVATVAVISKPPVGEAVSSLAQLGTLPHCSSSPARSTA